MPSNWDTVSYVISSAYRVAVISRLAANPATPTEVAAAESVSTTHISRALGQLRDRSLVELAVPPDQSKQRGYELTAHGEAVWEMIHANKLKCHGTTR